MCHIFSGSHLFLGQAFKTVIVLEVVLKKDSYIRQEANLISDTD